MSTNGVGDLNLLLPSIEGAGAESIPGAGSVSIFVPVVAATGIENIPGVGAIALYVPIISGTGIENIPGIGLLVLYVPTLITFGINKTASISSGVGQFTIDERETLLLSMPIWGGDSGVAGTGIDLTGPATEYIPTHLIRKIIIETAGDLAYTTWDGEFHLLPVADGDIIDGYIISINTNVHATPTTAAGVHVFF